MNLRKVWLIAKREYFTNIRRRSFLLTSFLIPLISFAGVFLSTGAIQGSIEDVSGYKNVGIIDNNHILVDESGNPRVPIAAPFKLMNESDAHKGLIDKSVDGYYVLTENFINTGKVDSYNRPDLALNDGIQSKFNELIQKAITAQLQNPALATRLQVPLKDVQFLEVNTLQKLDESALVASFLVPFIFAMLIFIAIMTTSQFLMSGVVEEKENRMMELFVTSSRPSEMLFGKILGMGTLGLTQLVIWGVIGLILASVQKSFDLGQILADLQISPRFFVIVLSYFLFGYLFLGAIMTGLGALVNADREGRQVASLLSLSCLLPVFFFIQILTDSNGALATFFSLFPLTSPVGMIMRASSTAVPSAQIILGLVILAVSSIGTIWLSGRLMRLSMLNYGKRLGLRSIIQAARDRRHVTVSPEPRKGASI